jgi:hypothetical protein
MTAVIDEWNEKISRQTKEGEKKKKIQLHKQDTSPYISY